jgi:mRNA-degrading endonuclease toxin of MazEF toxin-antitoxin module
MPSYSKGDVVLVQVPFSDLSDAKVRPAVIVSTTHKSQDVFVVPITSKTSALLAGEFVMADWRGVALNVVSAIKRGLFTIHRDLTLKTLGTISPADDTELTQSLRRWLGL